jgi:phosphoenolpyruvate---glycerone phosphotransferase subunit DhaL
MKLTTNQFIQLLLLIVDRMEKEKNYLSELDRAVGDGDHGITMSIGWQAIKEKLAEFDDQSLCGDISKAVGMTFLSAVGSSVGPLYATAFMRGAAALQGKTELNEDDIVAFWVAAVQGIQERGKAQPGDKTMMDTWIPVIEALQEGKRQGKDFVTCLNDAAAAGEKGMEATKDMLSLKGRSSRLGERSLGHLDPGATSAYYIFSTFCNGVISFQTV